MVLRISYHCSAPVTGQLAGVPGTDSGHTNPIPMCLVFTQLLKNGIDAECKKMMYELAEASVEFIVLCSYRK